MGRGTRTVVSVSFLNLNAEPGPATRISQLVAHVAQVKKKALSPNLDSEKPNPEEKAWLDVDATGGTLLVPVMYY
jgi:hypothetical protein